MSSTISYRIATSADYEELKELFTVHYFPNEPFNRGWVNNDPVPEDIKMTRQAIGEGTSYVAVDNAKAIIVGACLTGVDDSSSTPAMLDEASKTTNKKWSQYLRLYAQLDIDANIYKRFDVESAFHVHGVAVHGDYRGCSIATKLVEQCFALGASLGHKVSSMNCSSAYTDKIAQKLKMEFINELAMDEIKDENGERLVYTSAPHTHIRSYCKRLMMFHCAL
jgi:ribosomal protein S18 acetylase RimI-like enzyme